MTSIRFFLFLLMVLMTGRPAHALTVDQMRFGIYAEKTRLVVDLSDSSDFRVFVLDTPHRLVIDLPDFDWRAGPAGATPKAGIQAIRHGNLQPGFSRIVMDMAGPVTVRSAFLLPPQGGKAHRLVIDYTMVSTDEFDRTKTKVYGTLTPADMQAGTPAAANTAGIPLPGLKPGGQGKKPIIVIDPGHGGVDPGAIGKNRVSEKNVTLALAHELKNQLEQTGRYKVLLTRDRDIFIKLADRVKFARKNGADLFVSIHADSIDKSGVQGASVYTLSEKASDEQTAKLAARENKADLIAGIDLSVEDEDVANILVDLAMRDTMNQSKFFAGRLVDTFQGEGVRTLDSPHRHAGFAVLKAADIPSVLVEAGFMSNRKESELLNSPEYRRKVAGALKKGIDAYFEQARKNQRI